MGLLVGYENEKREILQLKGMLLSADAYRACGIRIPRGLALFGEPGVGKTQLAKTVAGDGVTLVELRAASCCEDPQEALQAVFAAAKERQPAVILLDELDKIAGTSENFYMETNSVIQKLLLQELDKLSDEDVVLVVATCNDTEVLGEALLRPGRFDRQLFIEPPDEETREQILKAYFDRLSIPNALDFKYISRIIPGYTGAAIECLVNEVGIRAVEEEGEVITAADVRTVMNKLAFNGIEKSKIKDAKKSRMIATHEAGHAVVAMVLAPDSIFGASILPQGQSNGHIHFVNPDDGVSTVKDLEDEITVLLGGHVAERVILGEYLIGSGCDLAAAESRVRFLTTKQGAYGYESVVGSGSAHYDMFNDDNTKATVCKMITEKLNQFDLRAEEIIRQHRAAFDEIVEKLMDKQTLTREELMSIKSSYYLSEKQPAADTYIVDENETNRLNKTA